MCTAMHQDSCGCKYGEGMVLCASHSMLAVQAADALRQQAVRQVLATGARPCPPSEWCCTMLISIALSSTHLPDLNAIILVWTHHPRRSPRRTGSAECRSLCCSCGPL